MAAGKEKTETKWSVCSNCCGAIRISVQKLLVSDMLGLFLSEQKLNISDTMIVLPEMKTVEVQVGGQFYDRLGKHTIFRTEKRGRSGRNLRDPGIPAR